MLLEIKAAPGGCGSLLDESQVQSSGGKSKWMQVRRIQRKQSQDWAEHRQSLLHLYLETFSNFREEFILSGLSAEGKEQHSMYPNSNRAKQAVLLVCIPSPIPFISQLACSHRYPWHRHVIPWVCVSLCVSMNICMYTYVHA